MSLINNELLNALEHVAKSPCGSIKSNINEYFAKGSTQAEDTLRFIKVIREIVTDKRELI